MKSIFLIASTFAFVGAALPQNDGLTIATLPASLQEKTQCLNPHYMVFSPKAESKTRLPLLIHLHGSGGRGSDISRIQGSPRAVVKGIEKFGKEPCIVVAPQCLEKTRDGGQGTWMPEDLNILFEHLKATLPVDETRIYLTGNSMGGYGSWTWGGRNPEHFAAIAPVSGGLGPGGPKDVTPDLEKWAANLATVPVFAFAGAKDPVVPVERSERMIAAIRKAGGKESQLKIYPNEGHNAGRAVYSSAEFYDWLFSKKRD